jgi:SnoaL-like domain
MNMQFKRNSISGITATLLIGSAATLTHAAAPSASEARLHQIEDRQSIERLLVEKTFTDAAADIPKGSNFHVMSNFIIDLQGDRANARSNFLFYKLDKSKPTAEVAGRYEDVLIRENGVWRFLLRTALPPG